MKILPVTKPANVWENIILMALCDLMMLNVWEGYVLRI